MGEHPHKYQNKLVSVDELFALLLNQQVAKKHEMWAMWEIVKASKKEGDPVLVWLKCTICSQLLSPSNPSRLFADHYKRTAATGLCAGVPTRRGSSNDDRLTQTTLDDLRGTPSGSASTSNTAVKRPRDAFGTPSTRQSSIKEFAPPAASVAMALKYLSLFFFKNDVSLMNIEDEDLVAAFSCLGVTLPSRKALSGPVLQQRYKEQRLVSEEKLASVDLLGFSTDGWRSSRMQGGLPLINVCILLPEGGSVFDKAVTVAGVSKDAKWIHDFHKDLIEERGGEAKVAFVVMDNTKANRKACKCVHAACCMQLVNSNVLVCMHVGAWVCIHAIALVCMHASASVLLIGPLQDPYRTPV